MNKQDKYNKWFGEFNRIKQSNSYDSILEKLPSFICKRNGKKPTIEDINKIIKSAEKR